MVDICKCRGVDCDRKDRCWRYTAPPGFRQSWFANPNMLKWVGDAEKCEYFIEDDTRRGME